MGEEAIINHHNRLIDTVRSLSPSLIYLSQPDIRTTIQRIAEERIYSKGDSWIKRCVNYCENSPYGRRNNLTGFDGVMEFFSIRKELELRIINQLGIPYICIENEDYDWDEVWNKIEAFLLTLEGETFNEPSN